MVCQTPPSRVKTATRFRGYLAPLFGHFGHFLSGSFFFCLRASVQMTISDNRLASRLFLARTPFLKKDEKVFVNFNFNFNFLKRKTF
jgi:hypothetical protein